MIAVQQNYRPRTCTALAVAAIGLAAVAGCARQSSPSRYDAVSGSVADVHTDTGQLTVRIGANSADGSREAELACLLTGDTEIYVNDRFSTAEALRAGDLIEVVGCIDPNAQTERFVVSFAYVTRSEPPAAAPALTPPPGSSDPQPQETR